MRATFFHDGPTYVDTSGLYYACVLNDALIDRYARFGELAIVCRTRLLENVMGYERITRKVRIRVMPDVASLMGLLSGWRTMMGIVEQEVVAADIVIARLPSFSGGFAIHYAKVHKKPFLVELVGCTWDALWNYDLRGKLLAPLMFLWMRGLIRHSPVVTYVSSSFLQRRYPTNGSWGSFSDVELWSSDEGVLPQRLLKIEQFDLGRPFVIGTVGAVDVLYKGQADVIRALRILSQVGINCEYHLIGSGNPSRLSALAEKLGVGSMVKLFGARPHHEVATFLDELDLYIQPSHTEGMPRALIEALSRACPALGSHVGGIPEILGRDCMFIPGRVSEIVKLVKGLDRQRLVSMATRNFMLAKAYDREVLSNKRADFYKFFAERVGIEFEESASSSR